MNEVVRAAAQVQVVCETNCWRFCFIGGLALQRWGEPRETIDVDLTLLTDRKFDSSHRGQDWTGRNGKSRGSRREGTGVPVLSSLFPARSGAFSAKLAA